MPELKDTDDHGGHPEHFRIVGPEEEEIVGAGTSDGWLDYIGEQWPVINEANARLIAAAPDLLEAAKQAQCGCSVAERESGHRIGCWMPEILAAIAKAER